MKIKTIATILTCPLMSLAQAQQWVELKLELKEPSPKNELSSNLSKKVYIPENLLKELIKQGRVITKDDESSMNCGGSDCTFGIQ